MWHAYHVPYLPLIAMMIFWLKLRLGGDPELVSPEALADRVGVPLLTVFGEDDAMVPPEEFRRPLERVSGPKERWVVPGAGHARCGEVAGKAFTDRLARFFGAHMPEPQERVAAPALPGA